MKLNNFFTSGWDFTDKEMDLKSRFQMVNIALVLSGFAFVFGIVVNTIKEIHGFVLLESILLIINIAVLLILRRCKSAFEYVTLIITAQCTLLLLYIIYTTDLESMKYIWIFTYPIVLLYFQKRHNGIYWFVFMLLMLILAPFQSFIEIKFSIFQIMYISVVLSVVSVIVYFYQIKMNEAKDLILQQQYMLREFNIELERQVKDLKEKDKLLTVQAKQAVMGEMISMIAHQWRQPLSTITLQISNLHIKRELGEKIEEEEVDTTLSSISDTIIYLSDTVDDFQTYFHPNKEVSKIEVHELIQRAINFALPRVKEGGVDIVLQKNNEIMISTYINEIIQVMLNILNNAIDALNMAHSAKPKILITLESKENSIIVKIKDNANGIDDKNLKHLFEPYFSTKGKNGTGLGLYMSQMVMQKQFETEIKVETSKDGSTFIVEIPKNI